MRQLLLLLRRLVAEQQAAAVVVQCATWGARERRQAAWAAGGTGARRHGRLPQRRGARWARPQGLLLAMHIGHLKAHQVLQGRVGPSCSAWLHLGALARGRQQQLLRASARTMAGRHCAMAMHSWCR